VEIKDNWDALGMRASGSHDVVFANCLVPAADFVDTGPWGEYTERYLAGNAVGTLGLVAVFLGIAEAAREHVLASLKTPGRRLAERRSVQHAVAEIEIRVATSRAMVARTAMTLDSFFQTHGLGPLPMDGLHEVMKEFQCTKWVVTRQAIEVVDIALTLSGGRRLPEQEPAVTAVPGRPRRPFHATLLAERRAGVHREGLAGARPGHRRLVGRWPRRESLGRMTSLRPNRAGEARDRLLTSRSTGPLARIRSPRPVNVSVRRQTAADDQLP
jgi:alkylation response protein AidB-like acyl-CoA dehydrogenase